MTTKRCWQLASQLAVLTLALATLAPVNLVAQGLTTSGLRGTVASQDGTPLEGATVLVTDTRTGATASATTNAVGRFVVGHLQPGGPYSVRAQIIGYRPEVRTGVRLTLGETTSLEFRLQAAAVQLDPIQAVAETDPIFSASRTGTATTVSGSEIASFPNIARDFTAIAELSPLFTTTVEGPSLGGQNNRLNNIQIDGAVNNDLFGLAGTGIPGGQANAKPISLEAIEEFQVLTAPFDVRHAGFNGGLINAVTKSGTNTWHGSVFGYHTNENFVSALDTVPFAEFNDTQFGFSLGGPLQRDKLHVFVNGEFEFTNTPQFGPGFAPGGPENAAAIEAGVHPDSIQRFISILEGLGLQNVGSSEPFTRDNPRTNLFARLDWRINERHRLVLRHNYAYGRAEASVSRGGSTFDLSDNGFSIPATTNSTVLQLFSSLGSRWQNELLINVEFVRERRDLPVNYPQITVDNTSDVGGQSVSRDLVSGAERFAQANSLDQNVIQLTNNLTGSFGNHLITVGTHNELFRFSNLFFESFIGLYDFASLADLEAGTVDRYQVRSVFPGLAKPEVEFSVLSLGGYVQDEWAVSDRLHLTFGVRADIPIALDDPLSNPDFLTAFGISTAASASGNILWQPRFGFNWNSGGVRLTQVRGGVGLFAGRPPFVWLSNNFGNTGRESTFLTCNGANAPALVGSNYPGNSPQACVDGTTGTGSVSFINIMDENFKFPLDFKASLGVDQQLPAGLTLTVEGLFTKAIEQVFMEEVNLVGQQGTDPSQGGRPVFGTPTTSDYSPTRVSGSFPQVIRLTNRSDNQAWQVATSLQRDFRDWLRFRASYTYSDVEDTQALISSQATSNFGRNPIGADPNNPPRTTSPFEVQSKVVLSATATLNLGKGFVLQFSPQYFGQSGPPYSYIVRGDINGDGYRGGAVSRDNDLMFIPTDVSTLTFDPVRSPNGATEFNALINSDACLSSQRGRIMERNSCRNPWTDRIDLRVVLGFPGGGDRRVQIVADVINLLESEFVQTSGIDRGLEALRVRGRTGGVPTGDLIFEYTGPTTDPTTGELNPFFTQSPQSNRRFQLGLSYSF